MVIKKGNNNPDDWEKIENSNTKTIRIDENVLGNVDDDMEILEPEDADENILDDLSKSDDSDDYAEVLQLTQYNEGMLVSKENTDFVVAEYDDIDVKNIEKVHTLQAKKFVGKITKFVLEFNDVVLTEEHKKYIAQVGQLQLQHLIDLLSLIDINKQMLNNIVARVNATQAEDYAILNSYINLSNQHLKLIKEVQLTYKSIPSVMKKMRTDVMCNQELEDNGVDDEVITSAFGDTQFNNGKQFLRSIIDKKKSENVEKPKE